MDVRDLDLAGCTPVNHLWGELVERLGLEQRLQRLFDAPQFSQRVGPVDPALRRAWVPAGQFASDGDQLFPLLGLQMQLRPRGEHGGEMAILGPDRADLGGGLPQHAQAQVSLDETHANFHGERTAGVPPFFPQDGHGERENDHGSRRGSRTIARFSRPDRGDGPEREDHPARGPAGVYIHGKTRLPVVGFLRIDEHLRDLEIAARLPQELNDEARNETQTNPSEAD